MQRASTQENIGHNKPRRRQVSHTRTETQNAGNANLNTGRAWGINHEGECKRGGGDLSRRSTQQRKRHTNNNVSKQTQRAYFPSVDGLRALAVLAVVAYHFNLPGAVGGLLGVTVFFVISGFLITSILLAELNEKNSINLPRFWFRRVRRLFPAIALVVAVTACAAWVLNPALLFKLKTDLLPALFWFTNWWYIFKQESYFTAVASPSPVLHFWSLSIEEQFYLIWPLILLILFRFQASHKTVCRFCLGLSIVSAILMSVLYDPTGDPSRVYYGTDTRAFSLLIGAYLAFRWPVFSKNKHLNPTYLPLQAQNTVRIAGLISFIALFAMTAFISGTHPFWYYGGLVLASVCSALLIACITLPTSILGRVLKLGPFVWLGTRSYGVYLWHYPLLLLMNPQNSAALSPLQIILQIAFILVVAEASYRFVENPIRHGAIGKTLKRWREGSLSYTSANRAKVACCASLVLVLVAGVGLACAHDPNEGRGLLTQADIDAGVSEGSIEAGENSEQASTGEEEVVQYEPLMIGDSVSVGLTDVFHQAYTGGIIDACGNRQLSMGQKVFDYYRERDEVGTNVIIALGSNGSFTTDALEQFVTSIGTDTSIWLVTAISPEADDDTTNANIKSVATKHQNNVHVIDWASYCTGHESEWLYTDGVHLTNEGRSAYMQMITSAIGQNEQIDAATASANAKAGGAWKAPADGSITSEMSTALQYGATPAALDSRKVTGEVLP